MSFFVFPDVSNDIVSSSFVLDCFSRNVKPLPSYLRLDRRCSFQDGSEGCSAVGFGSPQVHSLLRMFGWNLFSISSMLFFSEHS